MGVYEHMCLGHQAFTAAKAQLRSFQQAVELFIHLVLHLIRNSTCVNIAPGSSGGYVPIILGRFTTIHDLRRDILVLRNVSSTARTHETDTF